LPDVRSVIAQLAELCRASSRSKVDPIRCAIAAYHGSWERPDTSFADAVSTSVTKNDAPDFEMPSGAGIETAEIDASRRPALRDAEAAPSTTPDDGERARLSPLFPVATGLSGRPSSDHSSNGRPAIGEHAQEAPAVNLAVIQPRADGLFVDRSAPRTSPASE
jgi:hypothetical protein